MNYIDCFIVPIPTARLDDYRDMAALARKVWLDHGALDYQEYLADDVPDGQVTSLPMSVRLEDGEIIGIGIVHYTSREHRDKVMQAVMADERMTQCMQPETLPFDGQRMIWGGFSPLTGIGD